MSNPDASTGSAFIKEIDELKRALDQLRPLPTEVVARIEQKLRLDSSYHSNALEGNRLTLGETRSLILHGLTAQGKPMRDHLDIKGHDEAVKAIVEAVDRSESLNEAFIRQLHCVLLKDPYEIDAITPDGQPAKRVISIGSYKMQPNNVRTSTGETYYFTPPEQVKPAMTDLIDWYRRSEVRGEHPLVVAATFHYRFVRIHPFDDGNGRMARLLMNMILIKHGYTVAIVPIGERDQYIKTLEQADKTEDLAEFIVYIARCCESTLNLYLKAARGEDIEEAEDIVKEIALFKKSLPKPPDDDHEIEAEHYVSTVLYPLFQYCREKASEFSDLFRSVHSRGEIFVRMRMEDTEEASRDHVFKIHLKEDGYPWLKYAVLVGVKLVFSLHGSRVNEGEEESTSNFELRIAKAEYRTKWIWSFSSYGNSEDLYDEEYSGHDLDELKKKFNEMIRVVMRSLSDMPDDRKTK